MDTTRDRREEALSLSSGMWGGSEAGCTGEGAAAIADTVLRFMRTCAWLTCGCCIPSSVVVGSRRSRGQLLVRRGVLLESSCPRGPPSSSSAALRCAACRLSLDCATGCPGDAEDRGVGFSDGCPHSAETLPAVCRCVPRAAVRNRKNVPRLPRLSPGNGRRSQPTVAQRNTRHRNLAIVACAHLPHMRPSKQHQKHTHTGARMGCVRADR